MSKRLKIKPPKLRRSIPETKQIAVNHHALAIGKVAWAWNQLQNQFLYVFAALLTGPNADMTPALAIWKTLRSDEMQRKVLRAYAQSKLNSRPRILKGLNWAIKQADELSEFRNDAIHSPVAYDFRNGRSYIVPDFVLDSYKPPSPKKLAFKRGCFLGDLIVLSGYVSSLSAEMLFPGLHGPLPRRPQMQALSKYRRSNSRKKKR